MPVRRYDWRTFGISEWEHQHTKPRPNDRLIAYSSVYIDKLKAKQAQLFESDPELAMLLDNVAAVHAIVLADDIADIECDD
ncbi:hypothetical protein [Rhizobium leguminosarum]|uniref:hypothetical protein n=1 Tax=Rhizobium leguminosarum TaxID=384 RepID=UPI00103DBB7F|nr:hypothetical protein [Rhizobium leguminosarum]TBZ57976.1 hypothetical protein E0H48_16050 [Rhizobium leguminosarum bv. viciae]TCA82378.1 hypothetical protein E0H74_21520 [Rhizobium leguminosarum bv. viciae]TCA92841.1 hypothetical protein E0H76_22870 [Rhizobium leguminosarum bv. viciae]